MMPSSQTADGPGTASAGRRPTILHRQIADALRSRIRSGTLAEGRRIPSERTLSDEFGVSRVTVRQALKELEQEGLLETGDGLRWVARPTFSSLPQSVEEGDTGLVSFFALAGARGLKVSADVLVCRTRQSSLDEAEALGLAPGASVHELVRLRRLDDVPVVVDHSLVPAAIAPGLTDIDFTTASLYQTLIGYGCTPLRAEYAVEARAAEPEHAELLGMQAGDPVLEARQTTFDEQRRVIQVCRLVYHGERYRFRAVLERGRGAVEVAHRTPAESAALQRAR